MQKKISKEKMWNTLGDKIHRLVLGSYWILGSFSRVCNPSLGQRALREQ